MKVRINLDTALNALNKNLEEHKVELKEAMVEWSRRVIAGIESLRDAVTRDALKASGADLQNLFYTKPQDNRTQYSRYIGALKLAADNGAHDLEIDQIEYDEIFNDNWDWRVASKARNSSYMRR